MRRQLPFNNLAGEYEQIKDEVDGAIQRVLRGGQFVLGPAVTEFEGALAEYCMADFAVGVGSGTDALLLALLAIGLRAGDEVITTPLTFVATGSAIVRLGATPVFVDIDSRTYNLDAGQIEGALTPRTRAIVPVHLFGQPADMNPLYAVASRHSLAIIEDAAQAIGARYGNRPTGVLGDAAAFSFYPTKNLGAYGDGGAVVTNREDIARRVNSLRRQGERHRDVHEFVGFNSRLDSLQAAVLHVKIRYLDAYIRDRRARAQTYDRLFRDSVITTPHTADGVFHTYHQYAIRVPEGRDDLQRHLQSIGIATTVHYPVGVHRQPAFSELGYAKGDFPVAEAVADSILSLPCFPAISEEQQALVAEAILSYYNA